MAASSRPASSGSTAFANPAPATRSLRSAGSRSASRRSRNIGESRKSTTSRRSGRSSAPMAATAASATRTSSRACGRKRSPSAVSSTERLVRRNNGVARVSSSFRIRFDNACWVRNSAWAARPK